MKPRGGDARAKWDGVLIGATAGTQVHAVHGGRVVFADWLRGAGLLVILDHGNGYLSLYGHNQSLLKNAGDVVKAGRADRHRWQQRRSGHLSTVLRYSPEGSPE